jgi:putative transposase
MKKSRFTDSQIMDALKRVEAGLPVPELCRDVGISTATLYKWRAKYGGMDTSMMVRMKELEEENRRLKKLCVEAEWQGPQKTSFFEHLFFCRQDS